ncbi:MAG: Rrf2 family transcriptional regulator [Lentisphaerae bacterium]|nr:Rrf2 family transcriptional regulator [Lentisphaerota bacterium]
MNLINRDTDYAVRALCHMAQHPDTIVSVADLHPQLQVPRPYLRLILQTLAREQILQSFRGKGGGFKLAKPPAKIRLSDIIEIFQGDIALVECVFHGEACPDCTTCPLRRTVMEIEAMALKTLRATTIASLQRGTAAAQCSTA